MGTENKIDGFDEMLRLIYLDQVRMMDAGQLQQEVLRMREGNKGSVPAAEKELMMDRLAAVMKQLSLGELIRSAMQEQQVTETMIVERTGVSSTVIEALGNDTVYPNNVPIQALKKLVMELRLSYRSVKEAVLKTFSLLQQQSALKDLSGAVPAFRKGHHPFRDGHAGNGADGDGNELFENKEALDKYLNRLEELMNE